MPIEQIDRIFNTPITRRVAIAAGAGGAGLLAGARIARAQETLEPAVLGEAESAALSPEAKDAIFIQEVDIYNSKITEALGNPAPEQYSIIFPDQENNGDSLMAFDGVLFKQDPAGNVTVAHALTRLDAVRPAKGISDKDLVEGKLGGHIIPTLAEGALPVSQSVLAVVTRLGEAINLPLLRVSGATSGETVSSVVYRIGDDLGDYFTLVRNSQSNQLSLGNIAIPLTNAGLIPETDIIPKPETATGAGTTPTPEETQPQLSYPRRFTNADGSIVFNNMGNEIGLKIGDAELLEQTLTPLAKKFRPNGVEFFFPSLEDYIKQQSGQNRIQDRLKNLASGNIYLGGFTNSFLVDTGILTGERPSDGVTEIHLALNLKPGANPTPEDIREHSLMLTDLLTRAMVDISFVTQGGTTPELSQVRRMLVNRRIREEDKQFPLIPTLVALS